MPITVDNQTEHLDHPPSPEELAEIYMRAEAKDPRSLLYERVLVRPKIPVFRFGIFILLFLGFGTITYMGIGHLYRKQWLALLCTVVIEALLIVLLAKPLLIALVKTYQALASTKVRNRCRYEPSCSAYMILAVEKYGFWHGFCKGMKRWRSCKPPNGGYDLP